MVVICIYSWSLDNVGFGGIDPTLKQLKIHLQCLPTAKYNYWLTESLINNMVR